jgi:GT2 family glycosyltransferase
VRVLASPANVGAPAWNPIFRMARGAWVLILDDDAYLEGPDLRRAVAAAEANAADLVSFRVRSSVTPGFYFSEEDPAGLLSFWGCSALISRRALQELGGYDPGIFIWGNEVELTTRFLNRGLRHLYLHDVVSTHMKGRSPTTPFPARWHAMTHRHWAYGVAKNLQPLDAARILGRLLGKVALHSVARSPRAAWTLPAVLAGSVHGLRARGVPVRPEVSAVYRAHYQSYATPLAVVGRRLDRLRGRGLRYYVQRAEYYPQRNALIEL